MLRCVMWERTCNAVAAAGVVVVAVVTVTAAAAAAVTVTAAAAFDVVFLEKKTFDSRSSGGNGSNYDRWVCLVDWATTTARQMS